MSETAPRWVTVTVWRWRAWVHPPTWAAGVAALMGFSLAVLLGIGLAIACIEVVDRSAPAPWGMSAWAAVVVGVGASTAVTALACRGIARWASGRTAESFASVIPEQEPARGMMLADLRESGPPRDSWGSWHAKRWVEEVRRHSEARAFVARSLDERVRRYDVTERPVEPERIGGTAGAGSGVTIGFFAILAALLLWTSGPRSFAAYMFAAAAIGSLVRLVRRRALFAPVVAGQGWIEHGSARWTVKDSIVVVTGWSSAKVRIVGPPGVLTLTLPTARGREFEAFWMRWMHPAPDLRQRAFDA